MGDIATGLAVEAAKAITKVVAGGAFEEIRLVWGFNDELKKLKKNFEFIQALMEDLGTGKHPEKKMGKLVEKWLEDVKEVACAAENLLDDYAYEMLRRKIELKNNRPSFKKKCSNYLRPSTNSVVFRVRMTHRVKQILSDFDVVFKDAEKIGLKPVKLGQDSARAKLDDHHVDVLYQARKHAAARGSEFVGRDKDKDTLLKMILNPDVSLKEPKLSIIAIVGIGGLGKTTLARQLYEHEEVDRQFAGKKVWICVSEDFDIDKILKQMLESLELRSTHDLTKSDVIIKKIDEALAGKKLFLILDDVWNDKKDLWDAFKNVLGTIGGLAGSVILMTTRSEEVASEARVSQTYTLQGLSEEAGWEMLKNQVFNEKNPHNSSFDDVGRRIAFDKCKGVPLAIKSIAGLLETKQGKDEWESVESDDLWNIKDTKEYIMPSLMLSYNHINDVNVKQCFAYCAILPKDTVIEKDQLIALWLSQGFIHDENDAKNLSTAKETIMGEKYFNILVNYSFLQRENEDSQTEYKMHDLVHDLATFVSRKDLLVGKDKDKLENIDSHIQHLAFNLKEGEIVPEPLTKEKMKGLRTISFWNGLPTWSSLVCARYMRTLIMVNVGLKEVSSHIGQLVHLRYVDLSNNEIKELPQSMCKLYQLQTLRVSHQRWTNKRIRALPKELHKLESLRHIKTTSEVFASRGLRKLTMLQTLPRLELRDGEGWTIDELGNLEQLKGEVYIKGLEHVKSRDEAKKAGFKRKDRIRKINISWGFNKEGDNDEDVLKSLKPHPKLESLIIEGFKGVRFPSWIRTMSVKQSGHSTQLSHLTEVEFSRCKKCQQLPTLGQLPKLTTLKLEEFDEVECIGEELYGNESNINNCKAVFPSLRELHIINFEKLTNWMPPSSNLSSSAAFPNLETLEIKKCKQLERVPSLELKSLKDVCFDNVGGTQPIDMIKGCPALNSLRVRYMSEIERLPKELSNCRNLQKLEIEHCEKLKGIPSGMISLRELEIENCPSLGSIEDGVLQGLSSLRKLSIRRCSGLKKMGKSLEDCTSLEELYILGCPFIEDVGRMVGYYIPRWISQLHLLRSLMISGWGEEWDMSLISNLTSLTGLRLYEFPNMKQCLEPQPTQTLQQLLPPSLRYLYIVKFEEMEAVPEWIGYLSSLRELILEDCKRLKELPSKETLLRLSFLEIYECPLLKERCAKDTGPDWPKIQHIPIIGIDLIIVQDLTSKV